MVYLSIFIFKIIEDALATLRLIVVSNGKKVFGAILQFIVTLIWIILTGTVLLGIREDIGKAIAFALGALAGSYLGSLLEEKIALGTNLFKVEVDNSVLGKLERKLRKNGFELIKVKSDSNNKTILEIRGRRKKKKIISDIIFGFDKKAIIISEKIRIISLVH